MKTPFQSKSGQVLILLAVALTVLLALTGLAIDVGMAYLTKNKLNAAVDAAATAAGKVVSQGTTAISAEAANFFKANDPSGLLGATVQDPSTVATHNPDGSWTITVTATASSPAHFAKVVGWQNFNMEASATSTVRTTDLVLVMDCSGSIGADLPALKAAAISFINIFNPSSDRGDRVGLIHFAGGAVEDVKITSARGFDKTKIDNAINGFSVTGATTSEEAVRLAKVQLDSIPSADQSSLRAIVFFTDGAPNGVAGRFNNGGVIVQGDLSNGTSASGAANQMYVTNKQDVSIPHTDSIAFLPDTDWSLTVNLASYDNIRPFSTNTSPIPNTRCNVNAAARNMLENVANAARSEAGTPIHVFTIGLGANLTKPEVDCLGYDSKEFGANILRRMANEPGVDTYNPNQPEGKYASAKTGAELNAAFNQIASFILHLSK